MRPLSRAGLSTSSISPSRSEIAPGASNGGLSLAQEQLGNQGLTGHGAESSVARGGQLLGGLGLPTADLTPGTAPLSAMRALMRHVQQRDVDPQAAGAAVARSQGQALPDAVRTRMEAAFGVDLSHVRLHTDPAADEAAWDVAALAFALGDHVYFSSGAYQPNTTSGAALLVHELTHVIQHDQGRLPAAGGVSQPSDPHEREAARAASLYTSDLDISEFLGLDVASAASATGAVAEPSAAPVEASAGPNLSREPVPGPQREDGEDDGCSADSFTSFKEKKDGDGVTCGGAYSTDGGVNIASNGVSATASAEGQYGVGAQISIPLATKAFALLGEQFSLDVTVVISAFVGAVGTLKGELAARWASGTKADGIPKVDSLMEAISGWLAKRGTDMDPTSLTDGEARDKDKISGAEQGLENAKKNKKDADAKSDATAKSDASKTRKRRAKGEANKADEVVRQKEKSLANKQNNESTKGRFKKVYSKGTPKEEDDDQTSKGGSGKKMGDKRKKDKAYKPQNSGTNYQQNDASLRKDKGVSGTVSAEAFVGAKAGFALSADLSWKRKSGKEYGIEKSLRELMASAVSPGGALDAGLKLAEKVAGKMGVTDLLAKIGDEFMNFDAGTARLGGAKVEADLRAGVGGKLKLSAGFTGGQIRFAVAAGLTWGIGASVDTTWGLGLLPGAQLALALYATHDDELAELFNAARAAVGDAIADGVAPFFETWKTFLGWLSSDDSARQTIDGGGLPALSTASRADLLHAMLDGLVFNLIERADERCTVAVLEDARDRAGDLSALVASFGKDELIDKLWWFNDESLKRRALAALGKVDAPEPAGAGADVTT